MARQYESQGIYGAKITGGGSGGTVCLLAVGEEGFQSAKKIHRLMEESYQTKLAFFG
jgi:L-arabinokinase